MFGCDSPKEELIDLKDIIPHSERYDENGVDDPVESVDSIQVLIQYFAKNGIVAESIVTNVSRLFPDRFGPENSAGYQLVMGQDTLMYHKWRFKDSSKVMNAFYNWIDCFGKGCKSVYVGEEKNFQKNAMQLLVSDSTLIYIEGPNVDFAKWLAYHDSLGYQPDWNYAIEQSARSRAKWYTFKDKKKIKYEKGV